MLIPIELKWIIDLTLMIASFFFAPALIIAVIKKQPPPRSTCLMTAIPLMFIATCNYLLCLWLAGSATIITATVWFVLFFQGGKK